jgi:aryl-alcohol dehydrogenase-like predicted oxidoreductase
MSSSVSRRRFLKTSAVTLAGCAAAPYLGCGKVAVADPMKRVLGRTGFEVTTLGLGGQASLQWTPEGIDPVAIIAKAYELGVTYFDTSNVYGPSQMNYGKAFRSLNLVPGLAGYDEKARRGIHLASKTMVRHAKGSSPEVRDASQGPAGSKTVDDLRRTLSQVFGDGEGAYPDEAYLDVFFIHNLTTLAEVDAIYRGVNDPDPDAEVIGALAALRDYRDGTNLTGLNPSEEKRIRHIGISGHFSSPVMMECLQRDENNDLIDAMLIAINANDRRYLSHQYNAIPVARAKDVGIVAMKVFADGAMYTKEAHWSRIPQDVVLTVGDELVPSRSLVEYSLTTPGIATAIIGTGRISNDAPNCQLEQNLSAAQIAPESLADSERAEIEGLAQRAKGGETNWFQVPSQPLGAPRESAVEIVQRDDRRVARLTWQTAYAADEPISHYQILRDGEAVGRVEHKPQTTKAPFEFEDPVEASAVAYQVVTVDAAGKTAGTGDLRLQI